MDWPILFIVVTLTGLACIGFTLLMLWCNEALARLSKHVKPQMPKSVFTLALPAAAICAAAAAYGSVSLYTTVQTRLEVSASSLSIIHIVLYAIWGFSSLLLVVWFIGQRAKGRLRCPKCWYDMSGAPSLVCPECGKEARTEKKLKKSRRPRWALVSAVLMAAPGIYVYPRAHDLQEDGPLMLVPTPVLVRGWEHLPDAWIFSSATSSATLEDRLGSRRTSMETRMGFLQTLMEPMIHDSAARLDPDRGDLVSAAGWRTLGSHVYTDTPDWRTNPVFDVPRFDTEALLLATSEALLDAIAATNPTPDQLTLLSRLGRFQTAPVYLARMFVVSEQMRAADPSLSSDDARAASHDSTTKRYNKALAPLRDKLTDPAFLDIAIRGHDSDKIILGTELLTLAGITTEVLDQYADAPRHNPDAAAARVTALGIGSELIHPDDAPEFARTINGYLASDNDQRRVFALGVAYFAARVYEDECVFLGTPHSDEFLTLIRACAEVPTPNTSILSKMSAEDMALRTLIELDHDPFFTWPIIRRRLEKDPSHDPEPLYSDTWETLIERLGADEHELAGFLADQFAGLVIHGNEVQRYWLVHQISSIPPGTHERIDLIARRFLEGHDDGYVSRVAWSDLLPYAIHMGIEPTH